MQNTDQLENSSQNCSRKKEACYLAQTEINNMNPIGSAREWAKVRLRAISLPRPLDTSAAAPICTPIASPSLRESLRSGAQAFLSYFSSDICLVLLCLLRKSAYKADDGVDVVAHHGPVESLLFDFVTPDSCSRCSIVLYNIAGSPPHICCWTLGNIDGWNRCLPV